MFPWHWLTGSSAHWHWFTGCLAHRFTSSWHVFGLLDNSWYSGFVAFWISGFLIPWLWWFCFTLAGSTILGFLLPQKDIACSTGINITVVVAVSLEQRRFFNPEFCHYSLCIHLGWIKLIEIRLQCPCSRDLAQVFLIKQLHYVSSKLTLRCNQK